MILLEVSTESGATYVANVVNKRVRRIAPDGERGEWMDYEVMTHGQPGGPLLIYWPGVQDPTITTTVQKLAFPTVE